MSEKLARTDIIFTHLNKKILGVIGARFNRWAFNSLLIAMEIPKEIQKVKVAMPMMDKPKSDNIGDKWKEFGKNISKENQTLSTTAGREKNPEPKDKVQEFPIKIKNSKKDAIKDLVSKQIKLINKKLDHKKAQRSMIISDVKNLNDLYNKESAILQHFFEIVEKSKASIKKIDDLSIRKLIWSERSEELASYFYGFYVRINETISEISKMRDINIEKIKQYKNVLNECRQEDEKIMNLVNDIKILEERSEQKEKESSEKNEDENAIEEIGEKASETIEIERLEIPGNLDRELLNIQDREPTVLEFTIVCLIFGFSFSYILGTQFGLK
ncbi:unnamed protein product [Blepharisma stoltei]|uniref:Uncharacterized protein n=1 Tax=Blepharisma stoltei TaxID=1481888 RepID=A0AAU9J1T0_9CILI|nr:unnamed protein product [Blepharisma stoltei]